MKIREHRGSLGDSMSTVVEIDATMAALQAHVKKVLAPFGKNATMITVTNQGFDARIDWNSHIIEVAGYGVFGYCDTSPELI